MHIMYDDRSPDRRGDSYRLILFNNRWHVVARGYLCRVSDQEEGRRIIDDFKTGRGTTGIPSRTSAH